MTETNHLITSNGDGQYKCPECNKSFNYALNLRRHKVLFSHDKYKQHECVQCNTSFMRPRSLQAHMGQFPEDGGNGHFVSFFLKSRALVWPNRKR